MSNFAMQTNLFPVKNLKYKNYEKRNIEIPIFCSSAQQLVPGEELKTMCGTPEFVAPEVLKEDD